MALEDHLIDKRIVERSIKRGRVGRDAYQKSLDALPDLSGRVAGDDDAPSGDEASAGAESTGG